MSGVREGTNLGDLGSSPAKGASVHRPKGEDLWTYKAVWLGCRGQGSRSMGDTADLAS